MQWTEIIQQQKQRKVVEICPSSQMSATLEVAIALGAKYQQAFIKVNRL
jgi:hypothetical protein